MRNNSSKHVDLFERLSYDREVMTQTKLTKTKLHTRLEEIIVNAQTRIDNAPQGIFKSQKERRAARSYMLYSVSVRLEELANEFSGLYDPISK